MNREVGIPLKGFTGAISGHIRVPLKGFIGVIWGYKGFRFLVGFRISMVEVFSFESAFH